MRRLRWLVLLVLLGLLGCEQLFPTPVPQPIPVPVDPTPQPTTECRVLIVYESDANNSCETLNTLNSTALIDLLNARCKWRKWDKTSIEASGLTDEEPEWQAIWKQVSTSLGTLPKLVIVRGSKASVVDLPATEAATVELLRKAVQ